MAQTERELEEANALVYRQYVGLYWKDDIETFRNNKYLHTSARVTFVVLQQGRVTGTMSIIKDSSNGLPTDTFQPDILHRLRITGDKLAEVSALAMDPAQPHPQNLILFLIKYMMQYSFYYAGLDRLVVSCRPRHAAFYATHIKFQILTPPIPYEYASRVRCQLLSLNLIQAHKLLSEEYAHGDEDENLYRFLMVEEHPNLQFPAGQLMRRSRQINWVAHARMADMPVAV
ncbi:MAG: hypothetical protein HZA69_04410 [Gammaproteobacteria bacterium]|nr:hypothetical protein [Gammaproteobacteria bacterium]